MLGLLARDQATTDRWAVAESTYREAIELARESDQRTGLAFGLSGLAWLHARRGRDGDCRQAATEAMALSVELGTRLYEVWATAALGELELGLGDRSRAAEHLERAATCWQSSRSPTSTCPRQPSSLTPTRGSGASRRHSPDER